MKKYSKLKIVSQLMSRSLWDHTKDWLQNNNNYYDLFMAAQFISNEHPMFWIVVNDLQKELGISGDEVNEILEACEVDDEEAATA